MTVIKVCCPYCGPESIGNADVVLTTSNVGWAYYSFTCTRCHLTMNLDATPQIVKMLEIAQVTVKHVHAPEEFLEQRTGPPLDYDDLLDFALELGENWSPPTIDLSKEAHSERRVGPVAPV